MANARRRTSPKRNRRRRAGVDRAEPVTSRGTLAEWLTYLGADLDDPSWSPFWPPDAFAIGAALLRQTGEYVGLVNGWRSSWTRSLQRNPEEVGNEWRKRLCDALGADAASGLRDASPPEVQRWWKDLAGAASHPMHEAIAMDGVIAAAVNLVVAADSASAGIGIRQDDDRFLVVASAHLVNNGLRSFCFKISPDKLAVLGKQHTPQRGCTIRSLTHNLALYTPGEIEALWTVFPPAEDHELEILNLLLLPWPIEVSAADFTVTAEAPARPRAPLHRYFDYAPGTITSATALKTRMERALRQAEANADRIHAVVMPEVSLSWEQFLAAEDVAVQNHAMLVAGVRMPAELSGLGLPLNLCAIQPLGLLNVPEKTRQRRNNIWELTRLIQSKHHRWCMDRRQILQYELGSRLPASHDCWEHIFIGPRKVQFVTIAAKWLTTCVLICEDLARQDPVVEVIRSVGPNLLFALLMDGPQLRNRWSSRYASVLAEDPGCSVLTLTSIGMARRSRPRDIPPPADKSTTIALWRDAIEGDREIAVDEGHDACVLSLVCRSTEEFTIDGRGDGGVAHFPVFAGTMSFKVS